MTQELTKTEIKVINQVLKGSFDKPMKFEEVQKKTGLSRRKLQLVLEDLKLKGHPIGSHKIAPFGLYMARTPEELEIGMRANIKQAETTLKIASVQRKINFEAYWSKA